MTPGRDLNINDRFRCEGRVWIVRGWYSAVSHIAAEDVLTGERRVWSIHAEYERVGR